MGLSEVQDAWEPHPVRKLCNLPYSMAAQKADLATSKSVHTYYWFPSYRMHPVHISLAGLADSQEALRESSQMPHTQEVGRLMKQVWT